MKEIYDLIPLIKWYILLNFLFFGLCVVGVIWFVIQKGILKYAFRKNDYWTLHEKVNELDSKVSFTQNYIAEETVKILKQLSKSQTKK